MKTFTSIILIAGLALLVHLYLPFWWLIAITSVLVSYILGENTWKSFLSGFVAIFILWLVLTGFIAFQNEFILSTRMTEVIKLPHSSLLFLLTALIGGLVGGFSSLTGYYLKTMKSIIL